MTVTETLKKFTQLRSIDSAYNTERECKVTLTSETGDYYNMLIRVNVRHNGTYHDKLQAFKDAQDALYKAIF